MEEFAMKEPGQAHTEWTEKFGGAVRYRGLLGVSRYYELRFGGESTH